MADVKIEYGTASQGITVSINSLGSGSARESTAIDNTTNKFTDAVVYLAIAVGTVSGSKAVYVWFYGSEDGSNYTDNATGTDAAVTMRSPTNLRGPFVIAAPTNSVTYKVVIGSVAQYFGGVLPPKWGIVIENATGASLSSSGHTKEYRGVYATVA